jgi:hypothetical protein
MNANTSMSLTRRAVIGALAGGALAAGLRATNIAAVPSRGVGGGGGISGAGIVDAGGGKVQFAVHASRRQIDEAGTFVFAGDLRWEDLDAGRSLRSTAISFYGPPANDDSTREVVGELSVDGVGSYPFRLRVELDELAPLSQDSLRLMVEAIGYQAAGPVVFGEIALLTFGPPD